MADRRQALHRNAEVEEEDDEDNERRTSLFWASMSSGQDDDRLRYTTHFWASVHPDQKNSEAGVAALALLALFSY